MSLVRAAGWSSCALSALTLAALGCGARSSLEVPPSETGGAGGAMSSSNASSSTASAGGGCTVAMTTAVRLAKDESGIFDVTADASFAYWANQSHGRIAKVSRCDGAVTVLATGQTTPFAVAVDADALYFSSQTTDGGVRRISLAGGSPSSIWSGGQVEGLAVDDERVYFTVVASTNEANSGVWSIDKHGGGAKQLYAGLVSRAVAVDASDVYFNSFLTTHQFLARTAKTGGPIVHLGSVEVYGSITLDATSAYVSTWGLGPDDLANVIAYPKAGGARTVLASGSVGAVVGVAALTHGVAWTDEAGLVQFVPFTGGAPLVIAAKQNIPERIVAVDGFVFWADYGEGSVWMAPAP